MHFLLTVRFDHRHDNGSTEVGTYGPYSKEEFDEVKEAIVRDLTAKGYEKLNIAMAFDVRGPTPVSLADKTGALPTIRLGVKEFRQPDAGEILYELASKLKIGHHASPTAPPGT